MTADRNDLVKKEDPCNIDLLVGKKIKFLRQKLGWPLKTIAADLGVSLQQLQRYEQGVNRIPASLLYKLANILKIDISHFFKNEASDAKEEDKIGFNILIVEDNENDEFLLRKALEDFPEKLTVYALRSGGKAINFVRSIQENEVSDLPKPDLIFLDLNLPEVQGLEILKDLKRRRVVQNIPVVVLTNSMNIIDMREAYNLQASGFIRKSFSFTEFKENLHKTLQYWTKTVSLPNH